MYVYVDGVCLCVLVCFCTGILLRTTPSKEPFGPVNGRGVGETPRRRGETGVKRPRFGKAWGGVRDGTEENPSLYKELTEIEDGLVTEGVTPTTTDKVSNDPEDRVTSPYTHHYRSTG